MQFVSDPASWVQAGAEIGLLGLGIWAFVRDGFRAKREEARADRAELRAATIAVEAKADQDVLADRVEKVQTPEQAVELAEDIRELSPIEAWYEGATGIKTLSPAELSERTRRLLSPSTISLTEINKNLNDQLKDLVRRYPEPLGRVREAEPQKEDEESRNPPDR